MPAVSTLRNHHSEELERINERMLLKMLLYNSEVERMGQGKEQGSATNERTVRGGQWISDGRGIKQKLGNSSPNRSMVHIDRRTRDKSPTPNTPESMRARYHRDHLHHFLRAPLSTPLLRSTVMLQRTTAALVGVCVILTGAVSMPLKRGGVVLSGTIRSIDMLPKELVLSMRQLLALRCAPDSGGDLVTALIGSRFGLSLRLHRRPYDGLSGPGLGRGRTEYVAGRGYRWWEGCTPQ